MYLSVCTVYKLELKEFRTVAPSMGNKHRGGRDLGFSQRNATREEGMFH